MAPSPLVEAPAPAASEPASLNTLWGGHGRLTYPPSDGSRPSLTNPCVGGCGCFKVRFREEADSQAPFWRHVRDALTERHP